MVLNPRAFGVMVGFFTSLYDLATSVAIITHNKLLFLHSYTAFDSEIAFAILLGPTDPCSIAVSMEPFSTLALKGLT